MVSSEILSTTTGSNIESVFEYQISILEWYLKDHVTLKTRVMTADNSAFAFVGINYTRIQ